LNQYTKIKIEHTKFTEKQALAFNKNVNIDDDKDNDKPVIEEKNTRYMTGFGGFI